MNDQPKQPSASRSVERLEAFIRMDNDENAPRANCEDCGAEIPVELAKCSECES